MVKVRCSICGGVIPCVECSGWQCPYCGEEIDTIEVQQENQAV